MKKEDLIEQMNALHDNEFCIGIAIDGEGMRKYRYEDITHAYRFDDDFIKFSMLDPQDVYDHRTTNEHVEKYIEDKSSHTKSMFRAQAALIQQYFESEYPIIIGENIIKALGKPNEETMKKQVRMLELYKEFDDVKEKLQRLFENESWIVPSFIYWEENVKDGIYVFNAVYDQPDNTLHTFVIPEDFKEKITNILTEFHYLMGSRRKQINVKRK